MSDARWDDPREYDARDRSDEWPRVYDSRDRNEHDPREALMRNLDLPRGDERELVVARERVYEIDDEDSRALAAVGAFRVVPEYDLDLPHDTLENLHDQRLVELVDLGDSERGLTLTADGRELLNSHSLERDREQSQTFHGGVIRHVDLFRCLHHWTIRLLVPRRFRKAVALYKAAVREELWTPLNPSVSKSLEAYFHERQEQGGHVGDPSDRYIAQEFQKQGMPKSQALYRAWRRAGDKVLWQSCSTCLRDDWSYGRSAVEVQPLNRQYLQLSGSMDRDVWAKRGAKRKSRQVGPPLSTLSQDIASPLVAP